MLFALVDCNNFFASCEQVFNPKLEKKPLVILSNNDGCIIARSAKAKAAGIKMGDPAYLYKDRTDLQKLSSNFELYSDMSQRVMQTLESFSPNMEIYSIDEAFFLLSDADEKTLESLALEIRNKVKKWTGIPVSVGIAPTKTLAKIANEAEKKGEGVCILTDEKKIAEKLEKTPLEDVWGIGARLAERIRKKGILSAGQLRNADDQWIRKLLGVTGYRTVLELRGTSCFDLLEEPEKKKSIVCSRSFGQRVTDLPTLQEAVSNFAARAAEKLRIQESNASFISVFIVNENRESFSCHVQLPYPTSFTPDLIDLSRQCVEKIYNKELSYKKAGVLLADFIDADSLQFDLLENLPKESQKKIAMMKTLDAINTKYDKSAVQFAAQGIEKKWKSARNIQSPRFTTSWNEILSVGKESS